MAERTILAPFPAFQTSLEAFARSGLPDLVNRQAFRRCSGSTAAQLLRLYAGLGLIDGEGKVTDALSSLVRGWGDGTWADLLWQSLEDFHDGRLSQLGLGEASASGAAGALEAVIPDLGKDAGRHLRFIVGAAVAAKRPLSEDLSRYARGGRPVDAEPGLPDGAGPPPPPEEPITGNVDRVPSRVAPERRWDAGVASHLLVDEIYDPDAMPAGSEAERALMALLAALKRMRPG